LGVIVEMPVPTKDVRVVPRTTVEEDKIFWLQVRRAFLSVIDAIEERYAIPSVIEQHERRKAAQKS